MTGWTACLYKPNSLIVWSATPITRIAIIAVFVMTLMSVIAMMILTSFVTKRIRRLRSGMKEVEQGNFEGLILLVTAVMRLVILSMVLIQCFFN